MCWWAVCQWHPLAYAASESSRRPLSSDYVVAGVHDGQPTSLRLHGSRRDTPTTLSAPTQVRLSSAQANTLLNSWRAAPAPPVTAPPDPIRLGSARWSLLDRLAPSPPFRAGLPPAVYGWRLACNRSLAVSLPVRHSAFGRAGSLLLHETFGLLSFIVIGSAGSIVRVPVRTIPAFVWCDTVFVCV